MMPAFAINSYEFPESIESIEPTATCNHLSKLEQPDELKKLLIPLFAFFDVDDLTTPVRAGLGIDAMRHLGFTRIFIEIELWRLEGIVGTALTRARFGMSTFWIWHN
jgi:hypothetical protein